jgi:hypothetical protein
MHRLKLTMPPYLHILLTLLHPHLLLLPLAYVVTSLLRMEQLSVLLAKSLLLRVLSALGLSRVQVPLPLQTQVHLHQLGTRKKMKTIHTTKRILLCSKMNTILDSNNSSISNSNNSLLTPLSVDHLRGHPTMNGGHWGRQDLVMAMAISPSTTFSAHCRL